MYSPSIKVVVLTSVAASLAALYILKPTVPTSIMGLVWFISLVGFSIVGYLVMSRALKSSE